MYVSNTVQLDSNDLVHVSDGSRLWLKKELFCCALQKDRYTLIEQSFNSRITCMQHSQKNFMRIIGNDQKNNGQNFWEILERIIGAGLQTIQFLLKESNFCR